MKPITLLWGMLWMALVTGAAQAESGGDYIYEVRPGDTLGKIAAERLDNPKRWKDVARYNALPNPNRIEPGQRLRIQLPWLKAQPGKLKVEALSGSVTSGGRALKVGDEIPAGLAIKTAANSAARLRMPDGSLLNLMENTEMEVGELKQGNLFHSLLRLVSGQLEGFKQKNPEGKSDLAISAAKGVIGIRGTHFRMREQGGRTYAEIEEGRVSFEAQKTPSILTLEGGQGSVADGEHPAEVVNLLPAPVFPALPPAFATPYVEWEMPAMEGAQEYVGELARDEAFSDHVVPIRSEGRKIMIADLSNGQYWLRLRAVDRHGLQGLEGKRIFTVNTPIRTFPVARVYVTPETVQLRWIARDGGKSYQVQISDDQQFSHLVADVKTPDNFLEIPRLPGGRYFMRVRELLTGGVPKEEEWDVPMVFEVPN